MDIFESAAFWGECGALVYGTTVLTTNLWSGEVQLTGRGVKAAWARFAIAIVFGPIAAEGFGPTIAHLKWLDGQVDMRAVALGLGLSANYLWPLMMRAAGSKLGRMIGEKPL